MEGGECEMKDIMTEVYVPCLVANGFYPDHCNAQYCSEGTCYTLASDKGKGHFWAYCHHNLFSVYVQDFVFYEDLFLQYQQPDYISINYYDSVSGEELEPGNRLSCDFIKGHMSCGSLYQAIYHKHVPIRSTGIVIIPEFYETYLKNKYPGEYEDLRSAFMGVNGLGDFPELVLLLRQIRNYRGTGIGAKLFYEGKVAEALSLIVEKTKPAAASYAYAARSLSGQDLDNLAFVTAYIDDHFAEELHLEPLARMACMGMTKLKYSFKLATQCTITEYIQKKRMHCAEQLLANSELNINQIAQSVGYKNSSRFCELFRKHTGATPNEYRKLTKSILSMSTK